MLRKHHCTDCARILECEDAFEIRSGLCTRYERSASFACLSCPYRKSACAKSGTAECILFSKHSSAKRICTLTRGAKK